MALPTDKQARKERPIARGVLDYFPDAIAEVANVSFIGNQQHNPGEEMHWAREKSTDHADCIVRHLIERGTMDDDGTRHSAKAAWRALALLQLEIEASQPTFNGIPIMHASDIRLSGIKFSDGVDVSYTSIDSRAIEDFELLRGIGCPENIAKQIVAGISYQERGPVAQGYVYVAGPMRGYPQFNFPAFDTRRDKLVAAGYNVISPADIDRGAGFDPEEPDPNAPLDQKAFFLRDVFALLLVSHRSPNREGFISLLPGWVNSKGATAEYHMAHWLDMDAREE